MFSNYFIQDALCQNLVYEISFEQQEIFEIILSYNFTRSKTTQYNINYTVLHLILILFCAKICCFAAILFFENFLATPLQIVLSKFVFFFVRLPSKLCVCSQHSICSLQILQESHIIGVKCKAIIEITNRNVKRSKVVSSLMRKIMLFQQTITIHFYPILELWANFGPNILFGAFRIGK